MGILFRRGAESVKALLPRDVLRSHLPSKVSPTRQIMSVTVIRLPSCLTILRTFAAIDRFVSSFCGNTTLTRHPDLPAPKAGVETKTLLRYITRKIRAAPIFSPVSGHTGLCRKIGLPKENRLWTYFGSKDRFSFPARSG